jgi:hypothetical protein
MLSQSDRAVLAFIPIRGDKAAPASNRTGILQTAKPSAMSEQPTALPFPIRAIFERRSGGVSPVFDLNQITMPPKSIKSFVTVISDPVPG